MLIEHRGSRPRVAPTAYVAPTAVVCGDVRLDEDVRVLFGAVISAEGGPVEVGSSSIVMEQAVVRGREGHPTGIGSHLLVGPHAVGDPAEVQGLGKVRACVVGYGWVSDPGRGEAGTAPRDHVGIQAHDYSGPPCLPPHHPPLPRPPSGWPRPYPWHPSSALVCSTTSPRSPIHATDEVDGTR
jgi:hypothetical protein